MTFWQKPPSWLSRPDAAAVARLAEWAVTTRAEEWHLPPRDLGITPLGWGSAWDPWFTEPSVHVGARDDVVCVTARGCDAGDRFGMPLRIHDELRRVSPAPAVGLHRKRDEPTWLAGPALVWHAGNTARLAAWGHVDEARGPHPRAVWRPEQSGPFSWISPSAVQRTDGWESPGRWIATTLDAIRDRLWAPPKAGGRPREVGQLTSTDRNELACAWVHLVLPFLAPANTPPPVDDHADPGAWMPLFALHPLLQACAACAVLLDEHDPADHAALRPVVAAALQRLGRETSLQDACGWRILTNHAPDHAGDAGARLLAGLSEAVSKHTRLARDAAAILIQRRPA
jgi:hypothetical protein